MVVPIWPEWVQHVPEQLRKAAWVRTLSVGKLNVEEGIELIRRAVPV